MSWLSHTERSENGVVHSWIEQNGKPLSHRQVHNLWLNDGNFALFYSDCLLKFAPSAFCWETPSIVKSNLDRLHEFVVVPSPALNQRAADPTPFVEHIESAPSDQLTISFPNLGRNGIMICPTNICYDYSHLAKFLRTAAAEERQSLWRELSIRVADQISDSPIWLSTAGLGVSWLHLRIDSTPKYYRHTTYKES